MSFTPASLQVLMASMVSARPRGREGGREGGRGGGRIRGMKAEWVEWEGGREKGREGGRKRKRTYLWQWASRRRRACRRPRRP